MAVKNLEGKLAVQRHQEMPVACDPAPGGYEPWMSHYAVRQPVIFDDQGTARILREYDDFVPLGQELGRQGIDDQLLASDLR